MFQFQGMQNPRSGGLQAIFGSTNGTLAPDVLRTQSSADCHRAGWRFPAIRSTVVSGQPYYTWRLVYWIFDRKRWLLTTKNNFLIFIREPFKMIPIYDE
jgi:hypothetical protein